MRPSARAWFPLVLAFASGSAGLAHQLLWTRRLVDLLGGASLTFSRVTGAFFLGLALGAALAAWLPPARRRPWRRVAAAELAAALLSLPVMVSYYLGTLALPLWGREVLQWLAPLLLIIPPALAMGLVIPWMLHGLSQTAQKSAVGLYAANTLGGLSGAVWVILWGLPVLGLTGSGLLAAGLNLLVGAGALLRSRQEIKMEAAEPRAAPQASFSIPRAFFGIAFLSGFAALGLEALIQHQLAQVTINSMFSSAATLAWALLGLGLAALAAERALRKLGAEALLGRAALAAGLACALQPFVFLALRSGVEPLSYELPPAHYFFQLCLLNLAAVFPVFAACGFLFPALMRAAEERSGGRGSAVIAGLLAWNGLGGWLGTEAAQYGLSRHAGLWMGMPLLGLAYLAAGAWRSAPQARGRTPFGAALIVLLFCAITLRSKPHVRLEAREKMLECRVGPEGVVAAVEAGPGDRRLLLNNTYSLGGTMAQFNQERQSHIPMLLHGAPRRVALLGIATGSTVAGAAAHPGVERVLAAELSRSALDFAKTHFAPWARGVFERTNVATRVEDGRWLVAGERNGLDVVIGDLFLPWRTGEGRMYSREHFEAVRASLRADGIFCQWLPMFQLTRPQFEAICRTFLTVFPEAFLVRGDFYTDLPILGLVGGRKLESLDWGKIEAACARLREAGEITDPIARHAEGAAMMVVGPLPAPPAGPVITLGNSWIELDAGRNVVGLQEPWFVGVSCAEWVRDIHRAGAPLLPEPLRAAHDAGQFFLTLEIASKLKLPVAANLAAQVAERLPRALADDAGAEWKQWPMRVKPKP